jgi:predicted anti-sigma-YlaC factor YlaD
MQCEQCREILSAALDGEAGPTERAAADAHQRACGACAAWTAALFDLHRHVRVRPAEAVPDLTGAVLAAAVPSSRPARRHPSEFARYALGVVAATQLVLTLPALFGANGIDSSIHLAREAGAFSAALSVAFLVVALQPKRAEGLLPMVVPLVLAIVATAVVDLVGGRTGFGSESVHVLDVAGGLAVWRLAHEGHARPPARAPRAFAA